MVFFGEYLVSFTSGGRLVLPKKIRETIKGNQFILTKGFDESLTGFNKEDWEERSKEFLTSSLINTENLELRRIVFSGAVYIDLDEQGRFVLPKSLLQYLDINDQAVFVGVGDHFEIWTEKNWQQYLQKAQKKIKIIDQDENK